MKFLKNVARGHAYGNSRSRDTEAANMQYLISLDSAITAEIMERNWLQHAS